MPSNNRSNYEWLRGFLLVMMLHMRYVVCITACSPILVEYTFIDGVALACKNIYIYVCAFVIHILSIMSVVHKVIITLVSLYGDGRSGRAESPINIGEQYMVVS